MSAQTSQSESSNKGPLLYLAEFESPDAVIHAAQKVRAAGYEKWDVHTPYPVHGMDQAMGLSDSRLGWIVIIAGLTGLALAVTMIQWMNGYDYPLIIGGKPADAIPSMVPIMFELTILLSAFGAVFGMFALNELPKHFHPIFFSDRFEAFSHDKFFISIEAGDKHFDVAKTGKLLESLEPSYLELVEEGPAS